MSVRAVHTTHHDGQDVLGLLDREGGRVSYAQDLVHCSTLGTEVNVDFRTFLVTVKIIDCETQARS